jgi:NADH/NAD ratio-sensing transcriptional regulator Rex
LVVKAGIKAILNFAPVSIKPPPEVICMPVDISSELKILSHHLTGLEEPVDSPGGHEKNPVK